MNRIIPEKAIVLYMPVIHEGYIELLHRHWGADMFLLSSKNIASVDSETADKWSRDIRAIKDNYFVVTLAEELNVRVFDFESIGQLSAYTVIVMPDEDISRVIEKLLPRHIRVEFDNAFLRWDWTKSTTAKEVIGNYPVTITDFDRFAMKMAEHQSVKSSDVWRRVGAVIPYGNRRMLCSGFNQHMPSPMTPYIDGDVRLDMKPGEKPEICTAIHAEASLIAQAAKEGIALNGKSIYVTTFPCSNCARSIAISGIKKVYFKSGYSQLDAAEILHAYRIEVFQVK